MKENKCAGSSEPVNIVGKNLKKIRKGKGWSQKKLSAKLDLVGFKMDQQIISKIEKGMRCAKDFEVKALCKALGCTYEQLLGPIPDD